MENRRNEILYSLSRKYPRLMLFAVSFLNFAGCYNFCRYREFIHQSPRIIAQNVLEEIPDQFLSYMEQHNILPKMKACATPPTSADIVSSD